MSRVILVDPKASNIIEGRWPPTGLCRLAKWLEMHGHEAEVMFETEKTDWGPILAKKPDFIGIGATSIQVGSAIRLAKQLRELTEASLILGGVHVSVCDNPQSYLKDFDYVVVGDGEYPILRIADGMHETDEERLGLYFGCPPTEYIPIDYKRYLEFSTLTYWTLIDKNGEKKPALGIVTSLGCFGKCKFCSAPGQYNEDNAYHRKIVEYDIDAVCDNIIQHNKDLGVNAFRIWDDLFVTNRKRLARFCERMKGLGFWFSCLTRADTVNSEDLKMMAEVGFKQIAIGVESGSDKILEMANKSVPKLKVREAVRKIKEVGIVPECLYMYGLPGEDAITAEETRAFAKELGGTTFCQYFKPYPGSEFYKEIKKGMWGKLLSEDLSTYDYGQPVFLPSGMTQDELKRGWDLWTGKKTFVYNDEIKHDLKKYDVSYPVSFRNREMNTMPYIIHANASKNEPYFKYVCDLVFKTPPASRCMCPSDLTILTWNTKEGTSPLEDSLDRMGVRHVVLGKGIQKWDRHQIKLTHEVLYAVGTKHVMACDALDAVAVGSIQRMYETYLGNFSSWGIVYGAEKNHWPETHTKEWEEERCYERGNANSPYKYMNSGFFIGYTEAVKRFFSRMMEIVVQNQPHCPNDEQGIAKGIWHNDFDNMITLDYRCQLCQSVFMCSGAEFDTLHIQNEERVMQT